MSFSIVSKSFFRLLNITFIFVYLAFLLIPGNYFAQTSSDAKDPVQLFNQAQNFHEKGDLKNALKLYEEALKAAPDFPEALYQKGIILQNFGRNTEAEKSFRRAVDLRDNWVLPLIGLGETLMRLGKYSEAETILNQSLKLDMENAAALSALAELYLKINSSAENLKKILIKLENFPKPNAATWTARGAIESRLGNKSSAIKSLNNALSIEPGNQFALAEIIELSLSDKKFDTSLKLAQQLAGLYPNSVSAKLLLARVYAEKGSIDEALGIISVLDTQNPEVESFKNQLITSNSNDIFSLEQQSAKEPQNIQLLSRLCLITRTSPAKALDYCRKAAELDPTNINHAIGYAAALVQAKQYDSAIILLRKLLTYDPEKYVIHSNLATALFSLKRYAEAKFEFQWLLNQKPDLAIAYYFLAIIHDNLAEYGEAKENYQKFLQLADSKQNQLEIEKVNLRLPTLEKQIRNGEGVKKRGEMNKFFGIKFRHQIFFSLIMLLSLFFTINLKAQENSPEDVVPPSMKIISKEEKKQIESEKDSKKRVRISLDLMELRLVQAEKMKGEEKFRASLNELASFQAILDNTLEYLIQKDSVGEKVEKRLMSFEIYLRKQVPRLETIRRDLPIRYAYHVEKLMKAVREARAKAVEPLFSNTVVPQNKSNDN